jgi:hypothetical protein
MTCPFCHSKNVVAPMVDVGVGEIPCGPAECMDCGAAEVEITYQTAEDGEDLKHVEWINYEQRIRMIDPSNVSSPWAVICPIHGKRYLTHDQYTDQMRRADDRWRCPNCNRVSDWDDANYEEHQINET